MHDCQVICKNDLFSKIAWEFQFWDETTNSQLHSAGYFVYSSMEHLIWLTTAPKHIDFIDQLFYCCEDTVLMCLEAEVSGDT